MATARSAFRVLLVEDNPDDVELLREVLRETPQPPIDLVHVDTLGRALAACREGYDLILLDLFLADSGGARTFSALRNVARATPVVVLTEAGRSEEGIEAVRAGAQDYLLKGTLNAENLLRAMLCSIERCRHLESVHRLSFVDEMTNLLNRRGFLEVSTKQLRLAKRENRKATVLFVDLDNMQRISEEFGMAEGDRALLDTARILRSTFREMDVIGRVGDDEFAVFALETGPGNPGSLVGRIRDGVTRFGAEHPRPYRLSLSVGFAIYDSATNLAIEKLLTHADENQTPDREAAGA